MAEIERDSAGFEGNVTYPVLAIAPDRLVMQLVSADALETMPSGYLGLFRRRRSRLVLVARDGDVIWLDRVDSVSRLFNLCNWISGEPFKRSRVSSPGSTRRRSRR